MVIDIVYNSRMSRNLKILAACGARPAIQYVLVLCMRDQMRDYVGSDCNTYIVATIIVGSMRNGTTSKTKRTNSHAVGLENAHA